MDLWNEYEGRSIDGLFPLERLIRPEGRSAFFTTTTSGTSTVIRLIESHFDEDEILARWTCVADLHQPNLLTLTRFGQAMMDETSLVYVVLEPTEADLSQILSERPLTLVETREVATSLIPALQALHTKGFLHEHLQPINVLAVGEMVKLRSDCIREAPEGSEGDALRARDVRDFATLLLECLTLQRNHIVSPTGPPLQAPFREIIHNGVSGTWGLDQMASALEATAPQLVKAPETTSAAAILPVNTVQDLHRRPVPVAAISPKTTADFPPEIRSQPPRKPAANNAPHAFPEPATGRIRVPLRDQGRSSLRWLVLLAVAVVCLMLFAAYTVLSRHAGKDAVTTQPAQPDSTSSSVPMPVATNVQQPVQQPNVAKTATPSVSGARESWRVVAFTYNRQDQASAKARSLEARFAGLHPSVFTPSGRAPFLVTLGGSLSRDAAVSLRDKLRRSGLPRDLYAQNYSSKAR